MYDERLDNDGCVPIFTASIESLWLRELNAHNALGIVSFLLFIKCWTKTNNVREHCERQVERTS